MFHRRANIFVQSVERGDDDVDKLQDPGAHAAPGGVRGVPHDAGGVRVARHPCRPIQLLPRHLTRHRRAQRLLHPRLHPLHQARPYSHRYPQLSGLQDGSRRTTPHRANLPNPLVHEASKNHQVTVSPH